MTGRKKPKILLISSIIPELTHGGPIVLYRHLVERDDFNVLVIGPDEMKSVPDFPFVERIASRLSTTRFHMIANEYRQMWRDRRLNAELKQRIAKFEPHVVLTVAHGPLFWLAQKVAKKMKVPLVSVFHDWWPYLVEKHGGVSPKTAAKIERRFFDLHHKSNCVLPICEGMADALGNHKNSVVVLPIPPKPVSDPSQVSDSSPKHGKIVYVGNMNSGYGLMLRQLIDRASSLKEKLRFVGRSSDWPEEFRKQQIANGLLSDGPLPSEEIEGYLEHGLALLVTQPIQKDPPVRYKTSFPSKLVHYLQFGRPILFWGPKDGALVQWASSIDAKGVFTDADPAEIVKFLELLNSSKELEDEMCREAKRLATHINADEIHEKFKTAIEDLVCGKLS